jgi:hypothetical protein
VRDNHLIVCIRTLPHPYLNDVLLLFINNIADSPPVKGGKPLTPSEVLCMRHQHLQSLHVLVN